MLLKVSYILLGYLLVDGFFLITNGDNVTLKFATEQENYNHSTDIKRKCKQTFNGKEFPSNTMNNITVHEGDRMDVIFTNQYFLNVIECSVGDNNHSFISKIDQRGFSGIGIKTQVHTIDSMNSSLAGQWICSIYVLKSPKQEENFVKLVIKRKVEYFLQINCSIVVDVQPPKKDVLLKSEGSNDSNNFWIYIAVAVVVAVIIISQTAVILYLKKKAKRMPRLDSLSISTRNRDENDKKRYSQPPGTRKSRFSRMLRRSTNKDDERIYETLEELRNAGELTPPVPPIETIPTLRKKKNTQTQKSPDVMSKSLPRPEKHQPVLPMSSTMHRIPERNLSPELDVSRRPPLPLPDELPEEESATPSRVRRAFSPIKEGEQSKPNTLSRPRLGIGQPSVTSELDSILKMRKASLATSTAKNLPPASLQKFSFPSMRKKLNKGAASAADNSGQKFVPESPNPLPTGKSAVLLGLEAGTAPKPKFKTNATKPPNPTPKPFGTSGPPKPLKTTPLEAAVTPQTPLKPAVASKQPTVAGMKPVKPHPGSVMLPQPPMPTMTPNKAPIAPAKPPTSVIPPKPSMPQSKQPVAALKPHFSPKIPPLKPTTSPNPQRSQFVRPAPKLPAPSIGKPPKWPPSNEPTTEEIYEEPGESIYIEEPNSQPTKFQKPTPTLPLGSIGKPPLPPPNNPTQTQEDVYEEYTEDPIYNSDDEWTYEPLQQYNIYCNSSFQQ